MLRFVGIIVGLVVIIASTCNSAQADYMQSVLADNPSAYYRLGELSGSTAFDSSGNGHQGTYYNVTLGQPGAIQNDPNTSASFNGINSIVDTNYTSLDPSFTIEAWVKPTQAVAQQQVIAGMNSGPQLIYNGNDQPGVVQISFFNGSVFERTGTTTTLPLNTWTYLVGTWNDSTKALSIYVNGVLDRALVFGGDTSQLGPYPFFQIGAFDEALHGGTSNAQYFNGGIDEVAYYSTALSASSIQAHYLAGAVPEPNSLVLAGIGLFGLGCYVGLKHIRVGVSIQLGHRPLT